MPRYTLETQRGRKLTIEADSPDAAVSAANAWDLEDHAVTEAGRLGVNPDLALRQMQRESGGNPRAVSPAGARGPMQLMPGTAKELGVDPDDPYQNITGGLTYYKQQLDAFGGDEAKALAAYNAGPGAVKKYGGVPPYAETQAYVAALAGKGGPAGLPGPVPQQAPPAAPPAAPTATPAPQLRPDDALGFAKGLTKPADNGARGLEWLASKVGLDKPINALGESLGLPSNAEVTGERQKAIADAAAQGRRPGKLGEFGGNVLGTIALSRLPGGPLTQGAASGAALSEADTAGGVLKDAAIGGVAGRVTAGLGDLVQKGAGALLSKAPKIPTLTELEAAKKAAYKAVENSGFSFPKADIAAMADDFAKTVASSALSKSAKEDALSIIRYARQQPSMTLAQLEKLRGDIGTALVAKGGDTGVIGQAFKGKIDTLIDSVDNSLVRTARGLNARFKKADLITRKARSGELRADKDYGGDFGRKVKDRLFPLIDPDNLKANLRGGTPDEMAAITRLATGTKTQNAASTIGGMFDPRRLGGKIMAGVTGAGGGAGAPFSGGMSLLIPAAQMGLGFGLTGASSRIARGNVDQLIRLIAAGGSKSALKRQATPASYAAERAIAAARPAAGLIGGSASASRARAKEKEANARR